MISIQHLRQVIGQQDYKIGFISEKDLTKSGSIYNYVSWLRLGGYHDGWFADPFILDIDKDIIILLVEEWVYKKNKGRISKLTIKRNNFTLLHVKPVLELDTHLSFPNIIKEGGNIYVYPENAQGGRLKIYKYDNKEEKLHSPSVLIEEQLVDCQIVKIDNAFYLFGTPFTIGALEETKNQRVYKADSLLGPYVLIQTITSDNCNERGAGQIYYDNGQIIRPCQDCNGIYGKAVVLKQLELIKNGFKEKVGFTLSSDPKRKNGQSLHTFNKKEGLCVIDGTDYHYRMIAHMYKVLFN